MQDRDAKRDLEIQTACPKSWDSLVGDDKKRFCSECSLHVHSSTALTRAAAHELVEEASERVCMRIVRDGSGAPVYLDSCSSPAQEQRGRPVQAMPRAAGWILAAGASLMSACQDNTGAPDPAPIGDPQHTDVTMGIVGPELMGEVMMPEELGDVAFPTDASGGGITSPECSSVEPPSTDEVDTEAPPVVEHSEMLGRIAPAQGASSADR